MPPKITAMKVAPKGAVKTAGPRGVLDRIEPMSFGEDDGIKMMLYGKSGSGKTTLAGSFPGRLLWIVCSAGKSPGELRSLNTAENRKRIKQVVLEHSDEIVELADKAAKDFDGFVLDHVTGYQDLVLGEIIGKPVPEQKGWGIAQQQDYAQCALQCKEKLRHVLDLSINVVFVGQERENERREGSELMQPHVGVATIPSLAGWLNTAVDYIGNTFIRTAERTRMVSTIKGQPARAVVEPVLMEDGRTQKAEYCLRTAPNPLFMTKFRAPKNSITVPSVIVDPDYAKIMAVIRGETISE